MAERQGQESKKLATGVAVPRRLTVPRTHHEGIRKLIDLDDAAEEELLAAFKDIAPSLDRGKLVSAVVGRVTRISPEDVEATVRALLALYSVRAAMDRPLPSFIEDVSLAVEREKLAGQRLSPDARDRFKERLGRLLSFSNLHLSAKALDLLSENERTLCNARIVTDIRPIFGEDASKAPDAVILQHVMKLRFHRGEVLEEFSIALDASDIASLSDTFARAHVKAKSLRTLLLNKSISCLGDE